MPTVKTVKVQFHTGDDDKRTDSKIAMQVDDRFGNTVAQSQAQSYGRFPDRTPSLPIDLRLASFTTNIDDIFPGGQFLLTWEPWRGDFGNTDEWHIDRTDVMFEFAEGGFRTYTIPGEIRMTYDNKLFTTGM